MPARKCAQTVMASPGPLNWRNEVSRHSQVTETVMNYSPQCESIKTPQGSVPSRPGPANPQANSRAPHQDLRFRRPRTHFLMLNSCYKRRMPPHGGCRHCDQTGSGRCAECGGTGKGLTKSCVQCFGTGACQYCNGKGTQSYALLDLIAAVMSRVFARFGR